VSLRPRSWVVGAAIAVAATGCSVGNVDDAQPGCNEDDTVFILAAQAVPSATLIPCITGYPEGWTFGGSKTSSGDFRFFLDSDRAGIQAVEVVLTATCDPGDAVEVVPAPDEAGTRRYEDPISLPPNFSANRYYTFRGGCARYRYRFPDTADPSLVLEVDQALAFRPREELVRELDEIGLTLCGAGAEPCAGGTGS
jgi:hypothetical protein